MKNLATPITTIALLLGISNAGATAFLSMEPRSIGMGGSSVAVGNSSQAHYYNPALLVSAPADEDFNVVIDIAGKGSDSDSLIRNAEEFSDREFLSIFTKDLNKLIFDIDNALNDGLTSAELDSLLAQRDDLLSSSNNLQTGIQNITNRSLSGDFTLGLFASKPGEKYGWAAYFNRYLAIAAQGNLHPDDNQLMTDIIDVLDVQLDREDIVQSTAQLQSIVTNLEQTNPEDRFASTVSLYGGDIKEFGFAYAFPATLNSYSFDVGITPKIMLIDTFDETRSLNQVENQSNIEKSGEIKSYTSLNLDFGVAKQLSGNWKSGLAVKNLLPQKFKTPNGEKVKIDPAVRIGVAYVNHWLNVGADFDISENFDTAGYSRSRYATIGAEFDIWLLQLRAGYRINLTHDISYPSLGLGLHVFGFSADIAVAGKLPDPQEGDTGLDVISGMEELNVGMRIGARW